MDLKHLTRWALILGGLNWGSLALFDWEIGDLFGGTDAQISQVIYIVVGVAAVYELYMEWNGKKRR